LITLIGTEGTSEYETGCAIRDALTSYWPGLAESDEQAEAVLISCGAKLAGYKVQDFDVVLCAKLRFGRKFSPTRMLRDNAGNAVSGRPVAVTNLMVAIEVKDHDANRIRLAGENVFVRYSRGGENWHNATQQNIDQVHALKQYFKDQQTDLYVHRLLVLRGLENSKIDGVLPRTFRAADLLTEIAAVSGVYVGGRDLVLSSCNQSMIMKAASAPIFRQLQPTSLDRRRMDRIASRRGLSDEWFSAIGQKLLVLRGRGGTGKTVLLLQAAWRAYDEHGLRTLLLTYNLALVADLRRTMAMMNISASAPESGIAVESVMAFIRSWLLQLGAVSETQAYDLDAYPEYCRTAVHLIECGAVTASDIASIKQKYPERFSYDYVMADEGQDWPEEEAAILKFLYGANHIVAADGVDQILRGARCDWLRRIPENDRKLVKLRRCLRMKANLAAFANAVAAEAGIRWDTEPNPDAVGGRVIILKGSYAARPSLNGALVEAAREAGNALIDFLVCVPPDDVDGGLGSRRSRLGGELRKLGFEIWDATDRDIRRDFPRGTDTLRLVQYASCRGLEGWTVVAEGLDSYWANCFSNWVAPASAENDMFRSSADMAKDEAWHKVLIPLTRSIDTLVITLEDPASEFAQMILRIAKRLPDIVETID
jgi:hypothetical protein